MYILFVILVVLASILMVLIVLIQNSKGGGLASSFAASNQIMGVRKTTDVLEKGTWILAGAIVALSVVSAFFVPSSISESSVILKEATQQNATNPGTIPGFGASNTEEAAPVAAPAADASATETPAPAAE
ncbi:MAG: preprotein translocase subunit SecG [Bacteroidaceae bacterium]|nr:preprotein translocase subunit SecG [Bacteroidaceae bacterium]